jgi:pimeloyl-ACP methyl ester carboxylesterase
LPLILCTLLAACGDDDPTGPPPGPEPAELPIETSAELQACVSGVAPDGALTEVCLPDLWNGEILLWAHGYTNPGPDRPPYTPLELPAEEASGFRIKDIVRNLGTAEEGFYGYAGTSYRRNGLVAPEAVTDLEQTSTWVRGRLTALAAQNGFEELPAITYLVGASEGGLSTVLTMEKTGATSLFDGGLALCAPAGDFQRQIDWFGDFRVVFDHYFPGVMPGSAVEIPDEETVVTDVNWASTEAAIGAALLADPGSTQQLLAVTDVPHDVGDPATLEEATTQILRYSFMGTNDATAVLGGNPFGNGETVYDGSDDDVALNEGLARHDAEVAALAAIESAFQTTGRPQGPLLTMHTTRDPVTPMWHADLYQAKNAGAAETVDLIPVDRFGHCGFSLPELLAGFSQLVAQVKGEQLVTSRYVFPDRGMQREFLELARRAGAQPVVIDDAE